MKINLEVIHSCTIKRKKPWPRITWIGKEKQQLFLLDNQRISIIDPKNGKTKKKISKLSTFTRLMISHNTSDNGLYFVAILNNGDLIVWNKEIDLVSTISGIDEFGFKLGFHCPHVFISNDSKKIILISSRNKVFIWEADNNYAVDSIRNIHINGNWSHIVPSKEIKTVEDNKELVLHVRFIHDNIDGHSVMCAFAFNYENKLIVNILKIKWINQLELILTTNQPKFETIWISHQPSLVDLKTDFSSFREHLFENKINCLYTRGAYVIKLSHTGDLLALACNQKYVERNCLLFMSPSNGALFPVNLRNFGLNVGARGRHYWIHDLSWMHNDLYLAGITKHGAIFLVSRLGHPLLIHAVGKEINMGPALYLTVHPLIIVRGKSSGSISINKTNGDASLSSTLENEDALRQRYSIQNHPQMPIFVCSDGYLVCIFKLQTAFSTHSRLIRELMHETIGSLNLVSKETNHLSNLADLTFDKSDQEEHEMAVDVPDWGIQTQHQQYQSEKSGTDSGVDSNEGNNRRKNSTTTSIHDQKISEGKIIFSFLPQILPISNETIKMGSIVNKMEQSYEYLQSSWSLLISLSPLVVVNNQIECDQIAKAIQQAFTQFSYLFLHMDSTNLKEFQIYKKEFQSLKNQDIKPEEEEFKIKVLIDLFVRMLKLLYFDPSCKYNPNSHMLVYISRFIEKFQQILLKSDYQNDSSAYISKTNLLSISYTLLNVSESIIKSIYNHNNQDEKFLIKTDSVLANQIEETNNINCDGDLLVTKKKLNKFNFNDYILENSWLNLMHYAKKYRKTLEMMGTIREKQLHDIDMLIILVQRRMEKFPRSIFSNSKCLKYLTIDHSKQIYKVNMADLIYLDYGNMDAALDGWLNQLKSLFNQIDQESNDSKNLASSIHKSIKIAHKIFYACLANYKLEKLVEIINLNLSPVNLNELTNFKNLQPPKPLQKIPIAIVSLLKSLGRFIALYLIDNKHHKSIYIYSIHSPKIMPNIISKSQIDKRLKFSIEIPKEKLTILLNKNPNLLSLFQPDKALQLFISTGLYDEAIYFLNLINDWKSSFLIEFILKENHNYDVNIFLDKLPKEMICEHVMSTKLCSLLGIDKSEKVVSTKLMEKAHMDGVSLIIKELLLCSVITKTNVLEPLLNNMIDSFMFHVEKLDPLVSDEFYLPAPPIYCSQMINDHDNSLEENLRVKLCVLTKCIIVLLKSSNLHVPLIKWYLESLQQASQEMNQKYGIKNNFDLTYSLNQLLISIRYQKLGYITDQILFLFRDFCCLLFYIDLRDRFSLSLRQYSRLLYIFNNQNMMNNENTNDFIETCLNIIDYGNQMLSYRSFFKPQNHIKIQDIVLSTIVKLTAFTKLFDNLNLEIRLACCIEKKPFQEIKTEQFDIKLNKLLETWKEILSSSLSNISMFNLYENHSIPNLQSSKSKLIALYGNGEDMLCRVYFQKLSRTEPFKCGGYDFERTSWCCDFLELFFKLGFDQTEDWDSLIQSVNHTPYLIEFFDLIRHENDLNNESIDRQYLMQIDNVNNFVDKKRKLSKFELKLNKNSQNMNNLSKRRGLFRSYSVKSFKNMDKNEKLKKSVSFSNLNIEESDENAKINFYSLDNLNKRLELNDSNVSSNTLLKRSSASGTQTTQEPVRFEQPYKVLDYGPKYVHTSNLAIWLMKWSSRFQKLLLSNNKAADYSFWYSSIYDTNHYQSSTQKITCLNANFLVACVYLADGNNLDVLSKSTNAKPKLKKSQKVDQADEDLTHIASSTSSSPTQITNLANNLVVIDKDEPISSSSTLEISSLTENQVKKLFKQDRSNTTASPMKVRSPTKQLNFSIQSKSKDESTIKLNTNKSLSSTFEASEFYNLSNVKPIQHQDKINNSSIINESNASKTMIADVSKTILAEDDDIINKSILNKSKSGTIGKTNGGTFEFITNLFRKSSSRSSSRSKSPQKAVPPQSPRKEPVVARSLDESKFLEAKPSINTNMINTIIPNNQIQNQHQPTTNIQELIRNELKRIVKIQHDTVMNFLNGGTNTNINNNFMAPMNSINDNRFLNQPTDLDQQLVSILKQQNQFQSVMNSTSIGANPVEFVIETKIKTIDPKTGHQTTTNNAMSSTVNYNQTLNRQNDQENYFMKTFDNNIQQKNQESSRIQYSKQNTKKSSFIKIPLLNMNNSELLSSSINYNNNNRQEYSKFPDLFEQQQKHESEFRLLDFKSQQSNIKIQNIHKENDTRTMNKHIKEFIEINTRKSTINVSNYPLLKLNHEEKQQQDQKILLSTIQSNQSISMMDTKLSTKSIAQLPIPKSTEVTSELPQQQSKEEKEIQVNKPMYDGYIISPDTFQDMLKENQENEKISADSAQAHYDATQHLRRNSATYQTKKNKKDTTTMTDNLENVFPIPPDILFKLKFDSKRMNRETVKDEEIGKDYVNVVDLDSDAVQDILKLIEYEQNKRQGKYVDVKRIVSPTKNIKEENEQKVTESEINKKEENLSEEEIELEPVKGDSLTERILANITKTEDEWKDYDQIMKKQIEDATKKAGQNVAKQRMLNEMKYIDEKIKLMNDMTNEMSSDYLKYNKIADTIQELGKQREIIEKYQIKQQQEDESLRLAIKNKKDKNENIKFYQRKEADIQISDFKKSVSSIKKPKTKPKKEDEEDELSDLKENEEMKIKNILRNKESTPKASLNLDDSKLIKNTNSITNILYDVFDELNIENADQLDSEKLDKILDNPRKASTTSLPIKKSSSKSPQRKVISDNNLLKKPTNKQPPSKQTKSPITPKKFPKKLNTTFEKPTINLKPSATVKIEKQKSEKRDQMSQHFAQQREEEAKSLLEDILIENAEIASIQKQRELSERNLASVRSPSSARKLNISSRSPINRRKQIESPVPLLNLNPLSNETAPDLLTSRMSVENKKPSLMAKTIAQLEKKEAEKRIETENLLYMLENRAKSITNTQDKPQKPIKFIKSFTEMVKLQEPNKLRDHPDHKPLTYTEQLMKHQESTIVLNQTQNTSKSDIYKLYGTKRVKGIYDAYVKESPRKVKTYSQRLKELKPKESQTIIKKSSSKQSNNSSFNIKQPRHNLQKKTKNNIVHQNLSKNRFKPYENLDEKIDDLSSWSLDDKMKHILYDNGEKNIQSRKPKKNVTTYDNDQDTLADMDPDYMLENLLVDEKENERLYDNIVRNLSDIDKKEGKIINEDYDENDYINQVNLDDLENLSLSSQSALSSFIDWDQIDNLIGNFNSK